ncbi:MAG: hypothetical protein V1800_12285 [Candidatus Latescibacterota bacterium]
MKKHTEALLDVPPGERQLFLDDCGIDRIEGLSRSLHQPEKKGAVIRPDRLWESVLQTRCAPAWDAEEEVFKLWMITSTPFPGVAGTTVATSRDGVHWEKPILRQMEVNGSLENNFVTVDPKLTWAANAITNVVIDPDDPDPARRYKGLGHCDGREPLVSPDGIHWQRLDVPKIPSGDEANLSYDRPSRTFIAAVKHGGPYGRSVFLSTSQDFERWSDPELVFHADDRDQERGHTHIARRFADPALKTPEHHTPEHYNVDVYNMGIFRYEGLFIGLPSLFHQTGKVSKDWEGFDGMGLSPEILDAVRQYGDWTGFHHVQLACSRDLHHWDRVGDRQPFIDASPAGSGAYDLQCIIGPSSPVVRGTELWFYYTGIKHYAYVSSDQGDSGAICLAVLRRDGFVSLDAGDEKGVLVTRSFVLTGDSLFVNCDASNGEVSVQVMQRDGRVVAASEPITGDQLRERIHWAEGGLSALRGQKVTLRFSLRNARLYSYWVAQGGASGPAQG